MEFLRHVLLLCFVMLFSVFGTNIAFAVPLVTSEIIYPQTEITHFTQGENVGFTARAPPMAAASVVGTGGVTVIQSSAFFLHGQETVAAIFGFDRATIASNTGVRPPAVNPTSTQLAAAERLGVDPRWVKADGSPDWPPNYGFDGPPTIRELQPGQTFDRYGGRIDENGNFSDRGSFVAPDNVPFDQRSLPDSSLNSPYRHGKRDY